MPKHIAFIDELGFNNATRSSYQQQRISLPSKLGTQYEYLIKIMYYSARPVLRRYFYLFVKITFYITLKKAFTYLFRAHFFMEKTYANPPCFLFMKDLFVVGLWRAIRHAILFSNNRFQF